MKPCKIICILGALATLPTSVGAFDVVSAYTETSYGTVVNVEPVWDLKTNYTKTSLTNCDQTHLFSNDLGKTLFGAAVGSAVGNKLSNKDGFGSVGAIVGAVIASDLNKNHRRTCVQETIRVPVRERTLSHYLVNVKIDGKILQFKSQKSHELYDRLPFQIETQIKAQISGIYAQ